MKQKIKWLLISVGISSGVDAQKQVTRLQQVWASYSNQTRFSDKWAMWADFQLRTKDDLFSGLSVGIVRIGLTYYVRDNVRLTAGYAFVNFFPADIHPGISQPEHRPWQQLQWVTAYPRLRLMQGIRLEERFRRRIKDSDELAGGYDFNYRLRYNFLLSVPLSRKASERNTFSFVVNDEVHVNMGKKIVYNYFDQNRFFAGFAYHVNKHDNLQFGYLNVFQQLASGNNYLNIHAMKVSYFHNLDLRKDK